MHIRTDVPGSASVQVPPARFKRFRAASGSGSAAGTLAKRCISACISVLLRCHAAARRSGSVPLRQPTHVFKTCTIHQAIALKLVREENSFFYLYF